MGNTIETINESNGSTIDKIVTEHEGGFDYARARAGASCFCVDTFSMLPPIIGQPDAIDAVNKLWRENLER